MGTLNVPENVTLAVILDDPIALMLQAMDADT
jgi:hypothetical protein